MHRIFTSLFLILYLYNLAGYLAVFYVFQWRMREEVREMMKAMIPDSRLILMAFPTESVPSLQWMEENEFRRDGAMFDVVRSYTSNDSTYFVCMNDVQEERLNADLERHVKREMGASGRNSPGDTFKDCFKDSINKRIDTRSGLDKVGECVDLPVHCRIMILPDRPFHPPRWT